MGFVCFISGHGEGMPIETCEMSETGCFEDVLVPCETFVLNSDIQSGPVPGHRDDVFGGSGMREEKTGLGR